jgi:predicted AAA+ superfamily ATPase
MIMIKRFIASRILSNLHKGKPVLILGARQSGKTTLINLNNVICETGFENSFFAEEREGF